MIDHNSCQQSRKPFSRYEQTFRQAMSPIDDFIHKETSSGIILMICAITALVIANSPLYSLYEQFLHQTITIGTDTFFMSYTLHHWINDGLMALFFFVVGLEVKREILIGELSDFRQAILPIGAALGGMIIPALCYVVFNNNGDAMNGWGIPMATDIAFALGIIALLGSRVPKALVALLLAIAIVDDLGAVMIIAIFYTDALNLGALMLVVLCLLFLVLTNIAGVRRPLPYMIFGTIMWMAMMKSGVHATLAGVITAFTIPARSSCNPLLFSDTMERLSRDFKERVSASSQSPQFMILNSSYKQSILQSMEDHIHKIESPLQQLEHKFHIWISFIILPIFALANAGIPIAFSQLGTTLLHPVTMGVISGLIIGKTAGIFLFSYVIIATGISRLPDGVSLSHIAGISMLAGIGFTMSIFIGTLAFEHQPEYLLNAKIGIVFASVIAGIAGYYLLQRSTSDAR